MPDDSYVLKYLQFLGKFLSVGPPVLFVLNNTGKLIVALFYTQKYHPTNEGRFKLTTEVYFIFSGNQPLDFSQNKIQNLICGGQDCSPDSLQAQIKVDGTIIISKYLDIKRICLTF